ncbi:MAG: tetratricopeptide repeat protein, partial [Anaerolineae bacterium]
SVFRGGCTREAAQEVTGALTRDLMALVDRSLLQHTRAGRYEMHELLRQYAAERLTGSSRYTDVHDRHAAYYTRVLKEGYERYERHQREADLIQIAADIDNAQAAWDWAVARRRVADLQRAIQGLGTFYDRSVRYREGESVCRRAAEVLEEHASAEGLRVRAVVLKWQAKFLVSLGESARARTCYQRALALLDHLASEGEDTRCEEANALEAQVYEAIHRNLSEAENLAKRALGLYCELDDRVGQANALIALGFVAEIAERWQVARECYEASAALWQAMGHEWASVATRYRLAWVELALGHLDQAERRAQESYAFFRESKMPLFMWRTRGLLARVQMSRGQFAAAGELLADVLAHFQEMRDQPEARGTTHDLGFAGLHRGHYQEVEKLVRAIRAPGEKAGRREDYAESLLLEGQVSLAQRRYDSAAQYLQKSLDVHREWGRAPSEVQATLGYVLLARGELDQARKHLYEATRTVVTSEDFLGKLNLLPAAGLFLAAQGETARAVELYALATRYPYVANSRWFEDVAGRQIEAAAAELSPGVIAAAQARGRARDLDETVQELLLELCKENAD